MALTRKFLSALGIEEDKVDEIIKAHTETVDALKEQRDELKADAEDDHDDDSNHCQTLFTISGMLLA